MRQEARLKASDAVIAHLRNDIVSGQFPRGARLPNERELAARFGVSQPTVRESLRALEAMNWVEVRHGSGVYVAGGFSSRIGAMLTPMFQMERVGVLEVLEMREVLGLYSVGIAAQRATDDDVESLARAMAHCDTDVTPQLAEAITEFQLSLSAAAHSPVVFAVESFLIKLLMQFQLLADRHVSDRIWRERTGAFKADRARLLEELQRRDVEGLTFAMRRYLDHQRSWFTSDDDISNLLLSDFEIRLALDDVFVDLRVQQGVD
ncbi:FadR/GntR family transcriptional regulator [Nocardioides immobilis]|uniref:FadR/GntR family transcriptional regulator n=1 Tax=Nocardioides immobilis TaxID=2049295 RepID=UPI0011C3C037|nr:GntR family transcriptional regulator [Nocardioides immobilis]